MTRLVGVDKQREDRRESLQAVVSDDPDSRERHARRRLLDPFENFSVGHVVH
jgi:hypothetical protein